MPIKIQDYSIGIPQKFYSALTQTANTLALSQLWVISLPINSFRSISEEIANNLNKYEGNTHKWDIYEEHIKTFNSGWFIGDTYYLLAQSVKFPGDSLSISREGVEQSGMLKGVMGQNRNDLPTVTISFIETNQSCADLFFRPWMILVGHKSLKTQALRKNIELICFQKNGTKNNLKIRKIVKLYGCAPITIDNEEYNYTGDKVILREIEFVYNNYNIVANNPSDNTQTPKEAYDDLAKIFKVAAPNDLISRTLDEIEKTTQAINQTYNEVVSTADQVASTATRALRSIPGGEKAAESVEKSYNNVKKSVTQPVGKVIGTGNKIVTGASLTNSSVRDLINR